MHFFNRRLLVIVFGLIYLKQGKVTNIFKRIEKYNNYMNAKATHLYGQNILHILSGV